MESEQSTISSVKLDQILQMLGEMNNRLTNLENRTASLENEVKDGFEQIDKRILAVEIQTKNLGSGVNKAISVAYETLSVAEGLRDEVMALRAESAAHGRDIDKLRAA